MAMVLDAFASYVLNTLMEMAKEEVGMLLGVHGQIEEMGVKLGDLRNFLADADRRNITDKSVQEWVRQLKRAMYDITDILDICQLKTMERRDPSTKDVGCCNPLLFCLRNPLHAHNIGSRIKELNQKLDSIRVRSAAFGFIPLGSSEDGRSRTQASRLAANRETSGELDRSGVVGEKIEEYTRKLVELIVRTTEGETSSENNIIHVFAIVGLGGIGKTTLAKKVFNDETIQRDFNTKIWLSVNQNFSVTELLRRVIIEAGGDHQPAGTARTVLERTLKDVLKGKKVFMVMDDVWDQRAWEELKLPFGNAVDQGSRVLVTSRHEGVARGVRAVRPYHHIEKLDDEDGWTLLKKQVVSSEIDGAEIDVLKEIGLQIVAKCDGLPLAVKVMGGLLRQKDKQRREWEAVLNDSIWSVSEMSEELNYAVYLSYEDLPPPIKQCFLHYSFLPKTTVFRRDEIIGMWISEGFLHRTSDDLEEVGLNYHKELVLRNLIEPDTSFIDENVCQMHDVILSFAQFVARDEAVATHGGETDIISKLRTQKFLRLSLERETSESHGLDWSSLQVQRILRALTLVGPINMKPGDSLVGFPCLRSLHIDSANIAVLASSLDQLKHLRYLSIQKSDMSTLPDNIGKLKFLQYICLRDCKQFVKLPDSIVMLGQLRYLNFNGTGINGIPRGFCVLTNLRILHGFPARVDGDWCTLEELGPLYQLRTLGVTGLENVYDTSSAGRARLSEKAHLSNLILKCSSRLGYDGLIKEEEGIPEEEQARIEEVFDKLCPPSNIGDFAIYGYFGRRLPGWMMSTSPSSFQSLRILFMDDLACCSQLPDGLSQLSCLEFIQVRRAPSITRVGLEFLQPYHHYSCHPSQMVMPAFPRLKMMKLGGMVEWEEWEWEEQVQAMPLLEELLLDRCKLRCVPRGLASCAKVLKFFSIYNIKYLSSLENFTSVVELKVVGNPDLERLTNLPNLQKLIISRCPKLKVLKGVPALERLFIEYYELETLPEYMQEINPRHLLLDCSLELLTSMSTGQSSHEWDKFNHVGHVKAYANNGYTVRKWYVLYTRDPYSLETNVRHYFLSGETLLSSMVDAQGFEHVFKMRRNTFYYICSLLVDEDMMVRDSSYTFVDGRVMSLEDQVAVALIALTTGEPMASLGSSSGVNESTVTLVTERFVVAMFKRAEHHTLWPKSSEMEKIKSKFDNIHGLPNCCGVIHTTHFTLGPNRNHEKNGDGVLMQAIVDPDMRFTNIWLGPSDNMSKESLFRDSEIFKECEKGGWLNGSKLKASTDGSKVGEYIIGDAGYPLLPWLLTPFQEHNLSDPKVEFNRRHSAATAVALKALATFKDTWKCLHQGMWHLKSELHYMAICTCCRLHNIVIDLQEAHMSRDPYENYNEQVRQIADEDAITMRDILSQHLISISSRVAEVKEKEQEVDSSVSEVKEEDQQVVSRVKEEEEAHTRRAEEIVLAT